MCLGQRSALSTTYRFNDKTFLSPGRGPGPVLGVVAEAKERCIDNISERGEGFRSGYMGEKLWCIAVLDNPWFHAQDTVPLSIKCTYFQAETRRETWTKSHPKTSLLPALFLDSRNKSAHKQSVVYDKINSPNMRTEKRLLICFTPLRFGKCWFSFVSEKIFTHLPPAATYILYFSVAANFND